MPPNESLNYFTTHSLNCFVKDQENAQCFIILQNPNSSKQLTKHGKKNTDIKAKTTDT
jgi:hypothetical protein